MKAEKVAVTGNCFSISQDEESVVVSVIRPGEHPDFVRIPFRLVNAIAEGLRYVHETNGALASPYRR